MAKIISKTVSAGESGSLAKGFYSAGIYNNGDSNALVNGVILPAGLSLTLPAVPSGDYIEELPYDAQSSTLLIHVIY